MIGAEKKRSKTSGKIVIGEKKNKKERKYSRQPSNFSPPPDHFFSPKTETEKT